MQILQFPDGSWGLTVLKNIFLRFIDLKSLKMVWKKSSLIWNFFPWFWLKNPFFPDFPDWKVFKIFPEFPDRWEPWFLPLFLRAWYSHWQDITGYSPPTPRSGKPIPSAIESTGTGSLTLHFTELLASCKVTCRSIWSFFRMVFWMRAHTLQGRGVGMQIAE